MKISESVLAVLSNFEDTHFYKWVLPCYSLQVE